ncbi:MAG: hypothetical protein KIT49_01575 [Nitrospira sp.]|nr:hypothetical protein [Nitrospira sp.]
MIIVGAEAGKPVAHDLGRMGVKTLIVEQSLALGGAFWSGGYLMNKATICAPAHKILKEVGVPCKQIQGMPRHVHGRSLRMPPAH